MGIQPGTGLMYEQLIGRTPLIGYSYFHIDALMELAISMWRGRGERGERERGEGRGERGERRGERGEGRGGGEGRRRRGGEERRVCVPVLTLVFFFFSLFF